MTKGKFFNPVDQGDGRLQAPAAARNRDAIFDVLKDHIPQHGTILEVGCGTGEHAMWFAPRLKAHHWLPTDTERAHLVSALAWSRHAGVANILTPRRLDILDQPWPLDNLAAEVTTIVAINLVHIAPVEVMEALIREAGRLLPSGGMLYLYGPFKRGGVHTAPSNELFDQSLKMQNPRWGVRNMESATELAVRARLAEPVILDMPANNFSLIFKKP